MHPQPIMLYFLLVLLTNPWPNRAQMGLRRAPLPSPGTEEGNSSLSLFAKLPWGSHSVNHSSRIESSLAAIFRGVAYGMSTSFPPTPPRQLLPTSTTSTSSSTSTTTPATTSTTRTSSQLPSPAPTTYYRLLQDVPVGDDHREYHYRRTTPPSSWAMDPGLRIEVQQNAVVDPRGLNTLGSLPVQTPYVEAPINIDFGRDHAGRSGGGVLRAGIGTQLEWVRSLGIYWLVHVYCAAGFYSLLTLLSLFWLIRVRAGVHLLPRGYYITLMLLMFLAGFLRCVTLFHDPYAAQRRLPPALAALVEEAGWPCLTAALAVVVLALRRAWRSSRLTSKKPHVPLALALITAAHLLISVIVHVGSAVMPQHTLAFRGALRIVTAAWGSLVGLGSLVAAWRIVRAAGRQSAVLRTRRSKMEGTLPSGHPRLALSRGSHLVFVASLTQILLIALYVYAIVGPFKLLEIPPTHPWYWLALQSACRILEVFMWFLLGLTSTLTISASLSKRNTHNEGARLMAALSCKRLSDGAPHDKLNEMYPAMCQSNHTVRNFSLTCGKAVYEEALTTRPQVAGSIGVPHNHRISKRSATLNSATSDTHLLWTHANGAVQSRVPSDTSRPSSMLFNDSGFVRFRMHVDPQQAMEDVLRKSSHHLEAEENQHELSCLNQNNSSVYGQNILFPGVTSTSAVTETTATRLDQPSGYEDVHDPGQLEHLLQNHLNSELYKEMTGDVGGGEGTSVTDYSSTDALSPLPAGDTDWSKYASTCSSISAANSFDVRMYDDFDVATYYHAQPLPSASSHVYASLHHVHPYPHARLSRHYDDEIRVHGYQAQHAVEQMAALLAPQTPSASSQSDFQVDYLTDASHDRHTRGSDDSDLCSLGSHHDLQQICNQEPQNSGKQPSSAGWRPTRHVSPQDVTPDSAVVADDAGQTDDASGDEGAQGFVQHLSNPAVARPSGLLSKIVKNNFSLNNTGYSPLGTDDVFIFQQELRHGHKRYQDNAVRPCGHRPRSASTNGTAALPVSHRAPFPHSPTESTGVHGHFSIQMHQESAKEIRKNEESKSPPKRVPDQQGLIRDLVVVTDGTTQTDGAQILTSPSPPSSRPVSSLASHSDLPSECVDTEDEIHSEDDEDTQEVLSEEEDDQDDLTPEVSPGVTPGISPLDIWVSTTLQAAV